MRNEVRKFYSLKKYEGIAPDFFLPMFNDKEEDLPLVPDAMMKQIGPYLEAILNAVDGLKVSTVLSLLKVAEKAVMPCPVNTKEEAAHLEPPAAEESDP